MAHDVTQLRIYTVRPGVMAAWIDEWQRQVVPLRRRFGFEIVGSWVTEAENRFVWMLRYDGEDGWEAADAAYYDSPERAGLDPDPARHLASAEHWLMTRVDTPA